MRTVFQYLLSRRVIDMTPDGRFRSRPGLPLLERIFIGAIIVALVAGGLAVSALAFWIALLLIPVALVAAVIAWAAFQWRLWQARRSFGGRDGRMRAPDIFRRY